MGICQFNHRNERVREKLLLWTNISFIVFEKDDLQL